MAEIFTIVCENVAVSAAQDILAAFASSTSKLKIHGIELAANGQTTVGNYNIRLRRYATGVTPGSGGTVPTARNVNVDGAAPGFTAHANDTSQATGTPTTIVASQFNPINGYYWQPPALPDDAPKCDLSGGFTLSLDAVSGTINVSATMWVEEI